jgi:hypothetical protein
MPVRGQRGRCRPAQGVAALGEAAGWHAGIAPATRRQAACPPGTAAVAATARTDAVRCLPQ